MKESNKITPDNQDVKIGDILPFVNSRQNISLGKVTSFECVKLGIIWRGVVHDLSKFSLSEFIASAKYYNGDGNELEYQYAWLHHIAHNKHHWEYWVDWDSSSGNYVLTDIPIKYMKEMYADIIGASKAYNKGKFNKAEPYNYFMKSKTFIMSKNSRDWLENKLYHLANN